MTYDTNIKPPSDTFCILPWVHIATNASGTLRPCCNSKHGMNNFIDPDDGKPYRFGTKPIEEYWNSEDYKNLRRALLNGEKPEVCQRCWREEETGVESLRQAWMHRWLEDKEYTEEADLDIRYADIRLGTLCNLKCRMCNPYASSMWVDEWNGAYPDQQISDHQKEWILEGTTGKHLGKLDMIVENFEKMIPSLEEVYFTGGEPTIILDAQYLFLDRMIESGRAKKIKIKYNTNLTNVPQKLLDKWSHFKLIKLNVSIDGIGDLDRYIRYPSNWDKIEENFMKVRQMDNMANEIHFTVQMYNILRLPEFLDWAKPLGHKIYLNILNHPDQLNIRVLPTELKELAAKRLQPYLDIPRVQGVIDYMMAEDWSNKLPRFVEFTNTLDENRDQNILDVNPEFKDIFIGNL